MQAFLLPCARAEAILAFLLLDAGWCLHSILSLPVVPWFMTQLCRAQLSVLCSVGGQVGCDGPFPHSEPHWTIWLLKQHTALQGQSVLSSCPHPLLFPYLLTQLPTPSRLYSPLTHPHYILSSILHPWLGMVQTIP